VPALGRIEQQVLCLISNFIHKTDAAWTGIMLGAVRQLGR
jgi:hypothetical protein